jgi:hypothetical protein
MAATFDPTPDLPPEVEQAAQSGELVVFVGAGVSRLIGCPSWDSLANKVLHQLAEKKGINYYELSQIENISDPKKRLSIAQIVARKKKIAIEYAPLFQVNLPDENIYTYLNSLNSSFVTTNYEKYIRPDSRKHQAEDKWRFYRREHLLGVHLDRNGNVLHLHGNTDDADSMVITTKDYLDHYSSSAVQEFLRDLFERKTVVFIGYGLEEVEILEYILTKGGSGKEERVRRFILQGFFNAEMDLYQLLCEHYRQSFSTDLIGFPKDYKSYDHLTDVLSSWAKKLRFGTLALSDEAKALEDEIGG